MKHIYIHIPFCKNICEYCDFVRCKSSDKIQDIYVEKIISEINRYDQKFETIYIGGGTPNYLSDVNLQKLFFSLQKNINRKTEFTIECNPEFLTEQQAKTFKKWKINRVSIGAQTSNNKILNEMGRQHKISDVVSAVKNLHNVNIKNISLDFIYGFNGLKIIDLNKTLEIIKKIKVPHVSFYSLELKENSKLTFKKYKLDEEKIDDQLLFIQTKLKENGFTRYEVSNWAKSKKYYSRHNLCYWETKDWIGLGYGAYGFENNFYYKNEGSINSWEKVGEKYNEQDLYLQVLMMGLRLTKGLNLSDSRNKKAYMYFKDKINASKVVARKNRVWAKEINLLNDLLIDIV